MRVLREWGVPVAVIGAWWFALVWALQVAMAPVPERLHTSPPRRPVAAKLEPRHS
jgi:hypothetical protein